MVVRVCRGLIVVREIVDQLFDANCVGSRQLIGTHQVVPHLAIAGRIHIDRKGTQRMVRDTLKRIVGDWLKAITRHSRPPSFVAGQSKIAPMDVLWKFRKLRSSTSSIRYAEPTEAQLLGTLGPACQGPASDDGSRGIQSIGRLQDFGIA